jgi:hypothetical protein
MLVFAGFFFSMVYLSVSGHEHITHTFSDGLEGVCVVDIEADSTRANAHRRRREKEEDDGSVSDGHKGMNMGRCELDERDTLSGGGG